MTRHPYPRFLLPALALCLAALALPAAAKQARLAVDLGQPVLLAGQRQSAFLKVALTGFEIDSEAERAPVNVAVVLDKSGSMQGEKIVRAREAALLALERLGGDDVAAVVSYDSSVRVVVPATKLADRNDLRRRIALIGAGGKTALFAGVSKGAAEVEKFLDPGRVNRVILLSDGLANIGPASPAALGRLGASLAEQGIAVSTIGLGLDYNEDLMTQLAGMSDGNHSFAETAADLARIFDVEFGDVLSVAGQDVEIIIRCAPGVRPVRALGRDAEIRGRRVRLNLNQLYSRQEKFILLEVEIPAGTAGSRRPVAEVEVAYLNTWSGRRDTLNANAAVSFTASDKRVSDATDNDVMSNMAEQMANEMSKDAVELRDQGRVEEARRKLEQSADYLRDNAARYDSAPLQRLGEQVEREAAELDDEAGWRRLRKTLKEKQYIIERQQRRR